MKFIKFLILLTLPFCFSGCIEINEDISLTNKGSGKYSMKIEMGQLFEMMQGFMPQEELQKAELDKAKDTTILLKDFVDTASTLTTDQKALLKDGSIHLKMNMAEKVFNVDMQYPFTSVANFQKLYTTLGENGGGFSNMLKGLNNPAAGDGQREQPNLNKIASYFDLVTQKNSISRKLNKERYAAMANDSMMEQMKNMSALGAGVVDMKMNMTLHLPSPVKSYTGAKATLSDTKKTVTIQNDMLDIFQHPENFEFTVQY